jgi:hypothetical protein
MDVNPYGPVEYRKIAVISHAKAVGDSELPYQVSPRFADPATVAIDASKTILTHALDFVPVVGPILAEGLDLLFGWIFSDQSDVWAEIRTKVDELVNEKIADAHYRDLELQLTGIGKSVKEYVYLATHAPESEYHDVRLAWEAAQDDVNIAVPLFQDARYALALAPLFVQLANFHLLLLHDVVNHGAKWKMGTTKINYYRKQLADLVAPNGDPAKSYAAWVKKQFDDRVKQLNMKAKPYEFIEFERNYTVLALEQALDIWPHYDPGANNQSPPKTIERNREVYLGPFGADIPAADYSAWRAGPSTLGPLTGLEVWAYNKLDATRQRLGDSWRSR